MTNELIKLNERLLDHFRKGENIPDQLFLDIAWVIDNMKNNQK